MTESATSLSVKKFARRAGSRCVLATRLVVCKSDLILFNNLSHLSLGELVDRVCSMAEQLTTSWWAFHSVHDRVWSSIGHQRQAGSVHDQ